MKKLEMIVKPEKLEELEKIIAALGIHSMTLTNVMSFDRQKGYTQVYRGEKYMVNLLPKVKVELVIKDNLCENIVQKIRETAVAGSTGDEKIFIYEVADAIRICTGEQGEDAI